MQIQEVKVDEIIYEPTDSIDCKDCIFNYPECIIYEKLSVNGCLCNLFKGKSLRIKAT